VPKTSTGLTVRQYEREELELPVEFSIGDEHTRQIKLSSTSSAPSAHMIRGTLRDISPGGMGFFSTQFLPRMCEGTIRIFDQRSQVIFQHRVKVRRVIQHDRQPTYALGLAFIDPEAGIEQTINFMLGQIESAGKSGSISVDASIAKMGGGRA
jgi:hypothetical protein